MTTSITFALSILFDAVKTRFEDEGSGPESPATVTQVFGWREVPKQPTEVGRIVWTPGDESGSLGEIGTPKQPGRVAARPLATISELVTVTISAVDPLNPEDEQRQYETTRALYDAWYRAMYLAARGTFTLKTSFWLVDKKTRRYGNAIRAVVAVDAAILDAAYTSAPTDTSALVVSTMVATDDEASETIEASA